MHPEPPRILIIDDEPDLCWALDHTLRSSGYLTASATTGSEALETLTRQVFAIAFVDAKLPDLDGLELAAMIHQRYPQTAVILISGYFYQEDKTIAEGLDKNIYIGFVAKPFNLADIRLLVARALNTD